MKDLLKNKATKLAAWTVSAAAFLSVLALPIGLIEPAGNSGESGNRLTLGTIIGNALMPAAHAGRPEVSIYPSLAQIKGPAGEYDGPIDAQVMLGDIYSKNLARKVDGLKSYEHPKRMGNHFKAELFESAQRNRIEAYFWYSLAAAHLTFHELVTTIDQNSQPLTGTDKAYADYAWDRMQSLKKSSWRNKIVGPSFWTAEKLFVDVYRKGDARAHYLMAKFYKGVDTDFVVRSNYDAYVWMMAAEMRGYLDAEVQAEAYQSEIMYSQELLAELAAQRIVAFSMAVAANRSSNFGSAIVPSRGNVTASGSTFTQATPAPRRLGQNDGPQQVNWGSDFQSSRRGQGVGNVSIDLPPGVDTHHSSRSAFDIGNGHLAAGNIKDAKTYFEYAMAREPYSRSAVDASRQLQALTMTCSMKDDRVARMSSSGSRDRVHDIPWNRLQMALKALGYYTTYVDGKPGQETRRAIRDFQRGELNVDDTGYLTTDQRVELICLAAQDVRDAESQIQLGIMYARGIGLNCNTAAAHAWFQKAADQGHPTALYNLGLMYMEGFYDRHAPGSYPYSSEENPTPPRRVIDPDISKYFFSEAQDRGHPGAAKKISMIDSGSINKLMAERGVVGCIDYEAEVALEHYEAEIAGLSTSVGNTTQGTCDALKDLKVSQQGLSEKVKSLWKEIGKYDEHMGQSERSVNRKSIAQVREILKNTTKELDAKLSSCS